MVRVTGKKKRKIRRLCGFFLFIILSAAAGIGLYRLLPSLLDIGRIFRYAADKIIESSADTASAESVLRGTIFDRNFKELAVSYRLYSLYVRPAEINDLNDVVQVVADVTGQDPEHVRARLSEGKSIISIAENLEQPQVDMIKNARLQGLYIKSVEERFYPEHETAGSFVGFTGKGMGLAGVEGLFDTLLQEGEFRTEIIPGIDFQNEKVLGQAKVDLILTVDLEIQKQVEKQLRAFLEKINASRGIALLMQPQTGAVLAWASLPSFNPNYYWRLTGEQRKSLFQENLDPDMLRELRVRIAAIKKEGDSGDLLLPETVAVSDYGITPKEIEEVDKLLRENAAERYCLPGYTSEFLGNGVGKSDSPSSEVYGPINWAAAVAGLVNGGKIVSPYVLEGVYDHGRDRVYGSTARQKKMGRIFSPSIGVRIRHELATAFGTGKGQMILLADEIGRMRSRGQMSEYVMQKVLLGAVPAKSPELLLFMLIQQDDLYPLPVKGEASPAVFGEFGKKLLASVYSEEEQRDSFGQYAAAMVPRDPDRNNYNQFLISSRIDFQERGSRGSSRAGVMPQLVGLSLRKGLQHLNEYQLQVKVQGSGQIVSQVPGPGESLQGVGECVLTLGSEI